MAATILAIAHSSGSAAIARAYSSGYARLLGLHGRMGSGGRAGIDRFHARRSLPLRRDG
jgi:hypothetical protein